MPEPIRVGPQGRLVIPASLRRLMGIHTGDELIPLVEEGRLILATREALLADLQAEFAARVPPQVSLSQELLAERREEARREEEQARPEEATGTQGSP
jgi:AbrB family looped-hinge helix DNA binding protein